MQRLPESEAKVMMALWDAAEPVPRKWLDKQLEHTEWNTNTTSTYLRRLEKKGFVICELDGRTKLFRPLIEKKAYLALEGVNILQLLYGGSLKNFVDSLVRADAIDTRELTDLQSYLNATLVYYSCDQ